MRRAEALHPAALLVNQNGRVAPYGVPEGCSQPSHLRGSFDVPLEEDETPGIAVTQERALGASQSGSSNAGYESAGCHWREFVSQFRSSQVLAAQSRANFGIKGTLATI